MGSRPSIPIRAKLARIAGRIPLLGAGPRTRLARACLKPEVGDAPFEIDFFGKRYRGELGNYIDWSVYVFGAYERSLLEALGRLAERRQGEGLFLDVGANCGQHSLFMAGRIARVCSVEPLPALADRIQDLIELNGLSGTWRLERLGLAAQEGELSFSPPEPTNLGTGSFAYDRPGEKLTLPVRRGDDLEGLDDLAILKIDVEGFEKPVIEGLKTTIERRRPDIVMEWSAKTQDDFGGLAGLRKALPGYRILDIAGGEIAPGQEPGDLLLLPIAS